MGRRNIPASMLGKAIRRSVYRDPGKGCLIEAVTFLEGCSQPVGYLVRRVPEK